MNPNLIIPVGTQVVSRIEVKNKQHEVVPRVELELLFMLLQTILMLTRFV